MSVRTLIHLSLVSWASCYENQAAWLTGPGAWPFAIKSAPYPTPLPHEVVVKTGAVAINPVDWKIQNRASSSLNYPVILGEDIAGEVVEVGNDVHSIKVGDRVLAYSQSLTTRDSRNGGFQRYSAVSVVLTTKIPDALSYVDAAVLPLGIATAAAGLFQKDHLQLPLPIPKSSDLISAPLNTSRVVLVWGGSSSVGTSAIQLARAAGVRVATTASPHNHEYVKSLGAEWAFDYRSVDVVRDLVEALGGFDFVGVYDAIGDDATLDAAVRVVKGLKSEEVAKVVTVNAGTNTVKDGVKILGLIASSIGNNAVGGGIFGDFLPTALATGQTLPKPEPWVIGKSLNDVQKGVDANRKGVSAQKVVISLVASDDLAHEELRK